MVKNATGGNKSKKQARSTSYTPQQNIRKAKEEGEIYAVVTKIFGGPNCQVLCNDGVSRSCIIRNKFKTRGKRDNNITIGSWILVGIRDWEVRSDGTQKCDLLEVYSHSEKDKLKQVEVCDFKNLNSISDSITENNKKHTNEEQMEFSSSANVYEDNNANESSSSEDESSSSSENESLQQPPKPVPAKPVPAKPEPAKPVPAKPVSLRELMKTKTTKTDNDDWITINDI